MKKFLGDKQEGRNRYKFLSFVERVSAVNVDIFRNKSKYSELPLEGLETHFNRELHAWNNRTGETDFRHVFSAVRPLAMSLPMLLLHLEEIITALLTHLSNTSASAADAILSLIGILARDMRSQFYEHFPRVITALVDKLDEWRATPELLEKLFETLSYLFKYLQAQLTADINKVILHYFNFFEHTKPYIRQFAAESFAFLVRRLTKVELQTHVPYILSFLSQKDYSSHLCDGFGKLFFYTVKGVKGSYNSNLRDFLPVFFASIQPSDEQYKTDEELEARAKILEVLLKALRKHGRSADNEIVWNVLSQQLASALNASHSHQHSDQAVVYHMAALISEWVRGRHLSEYATPQSLAITTTNLHKAVSLALTDSLFAAEKLEPAVASSILDMVGCLVDICDHIARRQIKVDNLVSLDDCLKRIFLCSQESPLLDLIVSKVSYSHFPDKLLPSLLKYLDEKLGDTKLAPQRRGEIVDVFRRMATTAHFQNTKGLYIDSATGRVIPLTNKLPETVASQIDQLSADLSSEDKLAALWSVLQAVNLIKPAGSQAKQLEKAMAKTIANLSVLPTLSSAQSFVLSEVLASNTKWMAVTSPQGLIDLQATVYGLLSQHSGDIFILRAAGVYFEALHTLLEAKTQPKWTPTCPGSSALVQSILPLAHHPEHHIRSAALGVMKFLSLVFPKDAGLTTVIPSLCLEIEDSELNALEWRSQGKTMLKLQELANQKSATPLDQLLVIRYFFGILRIKLSVLWNPARENLMIVAANDHKKVWAILWELFVNAQRALGDSPSAKKGGRAEVEVPEVDADVEMTDDTTETSLVVTDFRKRLDTSSRTTDPIAFVNQLWQCLSEMHKVMLSNSTELKPLIDMFVTFTAANFAATVDVEELEVDAEDLAAAKNPGSFQNLVNFLKFFSQFKTPQQFHRSQELFKIFSNLLMFNSEVVQGRALDCLLQWKQDHLVPYKDHLHKLIGEKSIKDELTGWSMRPESTDILPQHRPQLLPVVIDILYPKLAIRGRAQAQHNRRPAILSFLASFQSSELVHFFELLFHPFVGVLNNASKQPSTLDPSKVAVDAPLGKQVGFLALLEPVVKKMSFVLEPFLHSILTILCTLVHHGLAFKHAVLASQTPSTFGNAKEANATVRRLGLRRLTELLEEFDSIDYSRFAPSILDIISKEVVEVSQRVHDTNAGGVMHLCLVLSSHPPLTSLLAPSLGVLIDVLRLEALSKGNRNSLYTLLENLLNLRDGIGDYMADDGKDAVDLLAVHVDRVLEVMKIRLEIDYRGARKKRLGTRELSILERLTAYAKSPLHAEQLVTLLVPYLNMKSVPAEARGHVVLVVKNLIGLLPKPTKYLLMIARLFSEFEAGHLRNGLCEAVEAMGPSDPKLAEISPLLFDLNSYSTARVNEIDFERRFAAFNKINEELIPRLTENQALLVVYNYFSFLSSEDMSIRSNAGFGLKQLILHLAKTRNTQTGAVRMSILSDVFLPNIRRHLDSSSLVSRQEACVLLSAIVQGFPELLSDLAPLAVGEEDQNFFLSVHHLQSYRRIRAVALFTQLCQQGTIKMSSIVAFVMPILHHTILGATSKQHNLAEECTKAISTVAAQMEWPQYYRTIMNYIRLIAERPALEHQLVKLLCLILDQFHFDVSQDFDELLENLRDLAKKEDQERAKQLELERAREEAENPEMAVDAPAATPTVAQTDAETPEEQPATEQDAAQVSAADKEEPEAEVDGDDDEEDSDEGPELSDELAKQRQMQSQLLLNVLPRLLNYLRDDKGKVIRVSVAMIITKLLKLLPESISKFQLGRLITRLVSELSSRAQTVRDSVRDTLKSMLVTLGGEYLRFTLEQMQSHLLRGYQLHVLAYTTYILLQSFTENPIGRIDSALPILYKILYQDLFGDPDSQKNEKKIFHSMRETKHRTAYESFQLTAQLVDFKENSQALIAPIAEALATSPDIETTAKLELVLERLAAGIHTNRSASVEDTLIFLHRIITDKLDTLRSEKPEEPAKPENPREARRRQKNKEKFEPAKRKFLIEPNPREQRKALQAATTATEGSQHVMVDFALKILHTLLKAGNVSGKNATHLQMLDPFVRLVLRCIGSQFDTVLMNGMRCTCQVMKFPLPAISDKAPKIASRTVYIMQRINRKSELMQMCFKTLAHIFREVESYTMEDKLLNSVMGHIRLTLEDSDNPNITFSILKSIVWRKILHPEIYDLIPILHEMLLQTSAVSVRQHCEGIIVQFLLTYPLSDKRLQEQLDMIMANLNFKFQPGRLAILNLLFNVFQRFPDTVLNARAEYFFVPLVAQMINDDHADCRAKASQTIGNLLKHIDEEHRTKLLTITLSWYSSHESKPQLARAASQLLALFIPLAAEAGSLGKLLPKLFGPLKDQLMAGAEAERDHMDVGADDEMRWRLIYSNLSALEKLVQFLPKIMMRASFYPLWEALKSLLAHEHTWVLSLSARLFGTYFAYRNEKHPLIVPKASTKAAAAAIPAPVEEEAEDELEDELTGEAQDFLLVPRQLFELAQAFCTQLKSPYLTPDIGKQIVKNLLYVGTHLYKLPHLTPANVSDTPIPMDEPEEDEDTPRRPPQAELPEDNEEEGPVSITALQWVFRRLSYMCGRVGIVSKTSIFQWFAAMATQLPTEMLADVLVPIIMPLYKVQQTPTDAKVDESLIAVIDLAAEVLELVQKKAGTTVFLAAYEKVRKAVHKKKHERKLAKKELAVHNPKRAAELKVKKQQKKRERKKRKIREFTMSRNRVKIRKLAETSE